ncbi:tyrosine-type recombinase/integrase [Acetanaerobacterium sp. MSJ-12]|uniref:tyrosine-type recombinase/integrase n=1 Tax=Acetanaerobacterium sp. MSJ-12 TaxID=2841535 RepID=UPI001C0E9FA9|nr:tyrosine-type recombinase/integrase [Acetanaerobacterium sp. MSJ-12]MBU5419965.1 tyrosine-type recombinase/integrase [Acetanaerobacterium sp. MSJ-12]
MRKNEAIWIEKSQRWQIKVQKDGVRRAFYSFTPSKRGKIEAEKKADKWLATNSKDENIRVGKLWADFLNEVKTTVSHTAYVDHESRGRNWILPPLEHKQMARTTPQDWQDCINAAYKAGRSKKTLKNIRGSIMTFCRYVKKRRVPFEWPDDLEIPKNAPEGKKTSLQPEQLKTLFSEDTYIKRGEVLPCFFIYAYRLLAATGLRRGELCALNRKRDLKKGRLSTSHSINRFGEETEGKTKNSTRDFLLWGIAQEIIDDQLRMLKERGIVSPWLFPDEDGQRLNPTKLYDQWCIYRRQHGITQSLHELRHTFTSLTQNDVPLEMLKGILGHGADIDTTGVYGHQLEGEDQRTAQLVDQSLRRYIPYK